MTKRKTQPVWTPVNLDSPLTPDERNYLQKLIELDIESARDALETEEDHVSFRGLQAEVQFARRTLAKLLRL